MLHFNPSQLRSFNKNSSSSRVIPVVCKFLLNVVNGNVPDIIPNLNNFGEADKILINSKTCLENTSAVILSKQIFYRIRNIL